MLRKASLIKILDRRLNSTSQDAMQNSEALKRKSPQPIIPGSEDQGPVREQSSEEKHSGNG